MGGGSNKSFADVNYYADYSKSEKPVLLNSKTLKRKADCECWDCRQQKVEKRIIKAIAFIMCATICILILSGCVSTEYLAQQTASVLNTQAVMDAKCSVC